MVLTENKTKMFKFSDFMDVNNKCNVWYKSMFVNENVNNKCCIALESKGVQYTLCETSPNYCSYKIRLVLKEILFYCM